MVGDSELLAFRRDYYGLFVSLLWREPAGEVVVALSPGLTERASRARATHPLLGEGWQEIAHVLAETPRERVAEAVAEEYVRLFIGPFGAEVYLYESYYLTGRMFDHPLAELRKFLAEIGVEKTPDYSEPEDFLAFELEVLRLLIGRQAEADAGHEASILDLQARFLKRHLLVWGPAAAADMASARSGAFYRGVGRLLQGFLELERDLVRDVGEETLTSLDAARERYARVPAWRGPIFDAPATGGASGGGAAADSATGP